MSTIDSYLKALLTLSGDEQLVGARRALLQSLNDEDLTELVKKGIGREFARGGLEDIASVVLDAIVRDSASVDSRAASQNQATEMKAEEDPCWKIPPASSKRSVSASSSPETRKRAKYSGTYQASQAPTWVAQPQHTHAVPIVTVSLRCQTEQVIANMTVPSIQCIR